jgi:DNA-binding response OmpR family regulator
MNGAPKSETSLSGTTVLVIEDEFYLAMDIKQDIERAGGIVLGPVPDTATTLAMISRDAPDCAIVDINLGEGASFEVAEELKRRNIPFLFLTGYDAASIPPQMADVERFEKPATPGPIIAAITRLAGR